ncbi:MAG: hypothetical protein Q4D21_02160 [Phascolarctobacterium sp.]|nr:hypothetical protein [Phascolarctobacterium sp.]
MCEIIERNRREAAEEAAKEAAFEENKRINKLIQLLLASKRFDDLEKSVTDMAFQKQLMAEFGI